MVFVGSGSLGEDRCVRILLLLRYGDGCGCSDGVIMLSRVGEAKEMKFCNK